MVQRKYFKYIHFILFSGCIKNGLKTAPQPIPAAGQEHIPPSIMVNAGHPEFTAGAGYNHCCNLIQLRNAD